MRLSHLGLVLALGGSVSAFQTVIPCGDDGNTISTCTVTATDQFVILSKTTSTTSATITASLAARRVQRVVVPAYSERYCLAQYQDLGPLALPQWGGSGMCGSRCDPPQNDQFVQTVRVVECSQNARQSTKVCSQFSETWSRTASGLQVPATLTARTQYNCPTAGSYTFQFTGTASRTYSVGRPQTTTITLRNGRTSTRKGAGKTIWYPAAPYTVQITKYVNRPTIVNIQTRITTTINLYLPTTTVTATATITYTKTTSQPTTTAVTSSATSSSIARATTTQSTGPSASPSRFYLQFQDISGQLYFVRFINGFATLVTQADAISGGADTFNLVYGFLQSNPNGNTSGSLLVGTLSRIGTSPIISFNGFPPGASQWTIDISPSNNPGFIIDAIGFPDAQSLCIDSYDRLLAVFSANGNACAKTVTFVAVQSIPGASTTSIASSTSIVSTTSSTMGAAVFVTSTSIYRGTGTLSSAPLTSTIVQPSGSNPGTVQVLYNPTTIVTTITDSGIGTRYSIVDQTGPTPGTVVVLVPSPVSTTTSTASTVLITITAVYRGTGTLSPTPFTSTVIQPSGFNPGTVQILYNPTTVTTTITDSGTGTRYSIVEQVGFIPGTVEVLVPSSTSTTVSIISTSAPYVTVTSVYRGTGTLSSTPFTSTVVSASGNVPGTVEILYNPATVTVTGTDSTVGTGTRTLTLAEQSGSVPGTLQVLAPLLTSTTTASTTVSATTSTTILAVYVTVTTIYRGTGTLSPAPSTTTVVQATGLDPGTVQVLYNPSTITSTILDSGNSTRTSTITEQLGSTPGTIGVFLPSYVVITSTSGSVSSTSTLSLPSGTIQGTLVVLVPVPTTASSAGYVFVTNVYRGTGTLSPVPFTTTLATPSGAIPGTIEVLYNPTTITSTSLQGSVSSTSVLAEQTGSNPGTIGVYLPAYTTISTVYRGTGTLSPVPSTTTLATPTGLTSGTVEIFYTPSTTTITMLLGTANSTSTLAEQTGIAPGTVQVFEPAYLVDAVVYTGTDTLTAPITTTISQPTGTVPGRIQVIYNPSTVTTTTLSGTVTSTGTLTTQNGPTPGTVEIFLPAFITSSSIYRGNNTVGPNPSISTVNQPTGTTPGTVQVLYNPTTVTITTLSGTATVTSTIAEQTGSIAGTVEIFLPGYITVTTVYRGTGTVSPEPSTSTINGPTGANPGTVDVLYNPNTVTRITVDPTALVPRTTTVAEQTGPIPGTVDVFVTGNYVTSTTVYRGTGTISPDPSLSTMALPSGTAPGTIDVLYNPNTITITTTDVNATSPRTSTIEQTGATPGTIQIIQTPIYVTTTTIYRGTGTITPEPSTTTIVQPSGSLAGTVEILYNPSTITITTFGGNSSTPQTSIIADQTGTTPGTIQIIQAAVYVTTTSVYRGSGTITPEPSATTIAQPTGTAPGTVEVLYNPNTITITTVDGNRTSPFTTTVLEQSGSIAGTVSVFIPGSYITTTSIYRGTGTISPDPSTTTIAMPNSTPGTVEILYNPTTVTVTTIDGNRTSPLTTTINEQTGSVAGTVSVILPGSYVTSTTVYRGTGTLTPDPSITTIATPNSTPGTVQVFYNPTTVTITTLDNGNSTRTSTITTQVGPTPGIVDVFLPSYTTLTITSGFQVLTTTLSLPTGTAQGTVEIILPSSTVVYCNLGTSSTAIPDPSATGVGSNKGVEYGYWYSPFFNDPPFDENTGFANYNVTYFDAAERSAVHLGQTSLIAFNADGGTFSKPIYADTSQSYPTENITLIYRGFLYARTTGTYTFTTINPDDIILVWVGQFALSGFTRANADIVKSYPAGTTPFQVPLTAGQYIPFRVQFANGGVPGNLGFQITDPARAVLLDGSGSMDVVTAACDGSTPAKPQWYEANYVTTTVTAGTAFTTSTTTLVTATGSTTGTVEVIVPTPVYCTSSTTVVNAPGASATSNVGLQYAVYNNTEYNYNAFPPDQTTGYQNYQVNSFDNLPAIHVGTTNQIGLQSTQDSSTQNVLVEIYTDAPQLRYNIGLITIIHFGFLFARQGGTYVFTSLYTDDITLLWIGQKALSGYNRANADLVHTYYGDLNSAGNPIAQETPQSFSIALTQGQYLPIRLQWGNGGPPGGFNFTVTGPDGLFRIATGQDMTDAVVVGCNGTTPTFPVIVSQQ